MGSRYKKDNIISAICDLSDDYDLETLATMKCIELLSLKMKLEQEKKQHENVDDTFSSRITYTM